MAKMVIPSVFTAVDKFSGPLGKMGRKSDAVFARMERNAKKVSQVSGDIARKSAMAGVAVIGGIAAVTKQAMEFETSMSNVNTLIDSTEESIDAIGDSVLLLAEKLPVPIEALTESLYSIRSAGIDASDQFEVLEASAKLGVAGLGSTTEATNIMTSALNSFTKEEKTANQMANILNTTVAAGKTNIAEMAVGFGDVAPAAVAANVSISQLSAATAALTLGGMKTASAQTKLKSLFDESTRTTGKLSKAYDKLGKGNIANAVTTDGFMKVLEDLKASAGGNEIAFKNMFSSQEAGSAALMLMGSANETYNDTLTRMKSGVDSLTVAYEKQLKSGASQGQIMMNQMQSMAIQVGKVFIPIMIKLIGVIKPYMKSFMEWAKQNKTMVTRIAKLVAGLGAFLIVLAGVAKVVSIVSAATKVWRVGMIAFNGVVKAAKTAQLAWNGAMMANPIGLIIAAVAALGFAIYKTIKIMNRGTDAQRAAAELHEKVQEATLDQRVELELLTTQYKKAEQGSDMFKSAMKRMEEIQPGIIEKYNLQTKALNGINQAEKELRQSILLRAQAQGATELIEEKTREKLRLMTEGTEGWDSWNAFSGDVLNLLSTGGTSLLHDNNDKLPFGGQQEEVNRLVGEKDGEISALYKILDKTSARQGVEQSRNEGGDVFGIKDTRTGKNKDWLNLNITNGNGSKIEAEGSFNPSGLDMPQMTPTTQ